MVYSSPILNVGVEGSLHPRSNVTVTVSHLLVPAAIVTTFSALTLLLDSQVDVVFNC
jgi:hypothetical protein